MKYIPDLPILSPKLLDFQRTFGDAKNKQRALKAFWSDIKTNQTPLFEEIDEFPEHYLVTFLFQEKTNTAELSVSCEVFGNIPTRGKMNLLIIGTNIYYKSIFIKKQTRLIYSFRREHITVPKTIEEMYAGFMSSIKPITDPLNPKMLEHEVYCPAVSILEMPDAPDQPWRVIDKTIPQGKVIEIILPKGAERPKPPVKPFVEEEEEEGNEEESNEEEQEKEDKTGFIVEIYLPPNHSHQGDPYPMGVFFDGGGINEEGFSNTPNIVNKLIAAKKIPPIIFAMVHQKNRMVELVGDPDFVDFLINHVVPELRTKYHGTSNPHQTVVGGISLGGLMSMYMGLNHPDIFGKVLSQSGSFWASRNVEFPNPEDPDYQFLIQQCVAMEKVDIEIYMEIGIYEGFESAFGIPSHFYANRWMRDILQLKGYPVKYVEYRGAHDFVTWRETWAHGMIHLFHHENSEEDVQNLG